MPEEVKVPEIPVNSPLYESNKPPAEVAEPVIEPNPPSGGLEPGGTPIEPKPYELAYKPMWEKLEKDGIKIPENFKKGEFGEGKDEWGAFIDTVLENTEVEGTEPAKDPFIENYLQVVPEKRNEYIQQYQNAQEFFKLPADDGLKAWYQAQTKVEDGKEVRKWDDAAIDKSIDAMSPIQKEDEWNRAKSIAQKSFDDTYKKGSEQREQDNTVRIENLNKTNLETAKKVAADIDKMTEFGGVPLTDDVKLNAKSDFYKLTQIDPTTGSPHLLGLLNDNAKLMKFILANSIYNGDSVKEYLSTQNEKYAKLILDEKLDIAPKPKSGSIGQPSGSFLPTKA